MNKTLYEINLAFQEFWSKIEEQDGELTDENLAELSELNLSRDEKLKNIGLFVRKLKEDVDTCKNEITRIKKIKEKAEKKVAWFEAYLQDFMELNNMSKFESLQVNISFRKSEQLEISDTAVIPKEFMRIKEEPNIEELKKFIKSGGQVDGCQIIGKKNIQIN